ncbi:STAS/SEC14 domain-containing protein [Shewanella atlantica]|uniref:STAS/SEC14 domain-containing protein n=1 Tax=Shewanella atlantica TaxID=271099 RepID=A0A3S0I734_9GAMM|nr:STAS/SEC14 domain-containing protein [Shewanella atlantica]RTR26302.1 STAS/SEC14 domain-containing protein [Shewanella atlantica]
MSIEFGLEEASNIFLINVSKKLGIAELRQAQGNCESTIKAVGNIKILVVLSDFQGWEKAQGWEDISFAEKNDAYIDKIAIVGDKERWEDLIHAFTTKGLRPVPIEFFGETEISAARGWLVDGDKDGTKY